MGARTVRRLARLGIAGAMALLLTGCPENAADIVEYKYTILNFDVAPMAPIYFTGGELAVTDYLILAFDTTLADAFDRSVAGTRNGYTATATQYGAGWNFTGSERTSANDPRLPALTDDDVVVVPSGATPDRGVVFADPHATCGADCPYHNLWVDGRIENLAPSSTYIVALFRYGLNVNGQLDAARAAMDSALDAPDELVPVGGTPSGDPTLEIVSYPTYTAPIAPDANPLVLGYFTSNASGVGGWDVVVDGTGVLYSDGSGAPADASFDSALVARNDDTQTTFPRYNYLVILEGPATDAADAADNPQAFRFQIGQDFDATTGNAINNGYAPFPTAIPTRELVSLPSFSGRASTVSVEFLNIEPLAGSARWQGWLVNREAGASTFIPASGTYERVAIVREYDLVTGEILSEEDSVLESTPQTSVFVGELSAQVEGDEQEVKHRLVVSDASLGGADSVGFFTDVVLSLEPGGAATTPSDATLAWFQYTDQNGTPSDFSDDVIYEGDVEFGTFDATDPASSRLVAVVDFAQSRGLGGVRENEVSVEITNLPLPPVGYYYEGWLVGPNGNAVSLGPIKGLPPDTVSLFDADIDQTLPSVTETGIRFVSVSAMLDSDAIVSQLDEDFTVHLTTFFLTLEPKIGAATKNIADLEVATLPTEAIINRLRNP